MNSATEILFEVKIKMMAVCSECRCILNIREDSTTNQIIVEPCEKCVKDIEDAARDEGRALAWKEQPRD